MPGDPFSPAELVAAESAALDRVVPARGHLQPWRTILRAVLGAVAPLIAARVRAETADGIARAITATASTGATSPAARTTMPEDLDLLAEIADLSPEQERIAAVLADCDEVHAATRPDLADPRDHSARCWTWHAGCLAARIRRTLTGEDHPQ